MLFFISKPNGTKSIRDAWVVATERMKEQCSVATSSFIKDLARRFPNQELMNAIGIVYP